MEIRVYQQHAFEIEAFSLARTPFTWTGGKSVNISPTNKDIHMHRIIV